jgi:hypothetical protein
MLGREEKEKLKKELEKLATPEEIFKHVSVRYDLRQPITPMIKSMFIQGTLKALDLVNAKPRKE